MSQKYCTVEDEYKRSANLKKEDVLVIQEWINAQPHLPKISEHKIIAFLNSCCYRIEEAKKYIEKFYILKTNLPQFTRNWNVSSDDVQQMLQVLLATVLPIPTEQNYQILYVRLMDPNSSLFNYIASIKTFAMITSLWFKVHGTSKGQVAILDAEGSSFGHMWQMASPGTTRDLYSILAVTPIRLKAVHIINASYIIDSVLGMAKPLMPTGMADLIQLHSTLDTLLEHVPKEALPNEYGGQAGTFKALHENLVELMKENAEYFLEEEKCVVDESKKLPLLEEEDDEYLVEDRVGALIQF